MAEPAFYQCKGCSRTWQRTEWKTRLNPPANCPHCGSADQEIDRAREDEYIRNVYGPITQHIGQILNTKLASKNDDPQKQGASRVKDIVIVIYCDEDGGKHIDRMSKAELLAKLKAQHWGPSPKFAAAGTVPDLDYFGGGLVVIDGDVVEPRPVQTATEFAL